MELNRTVLIDTLFNNHIVHVCITFSHISTGCVGLRTIQRYPYHNFSDSGFMIYALIHITDPNC